MSENETEWFFCVGAHDEKFIVTRVFLHSMNLIIHEPLVQHRHYNLTPRVCNGVVVCNGLLSRIVGPPRLLYRRMH